MKNAIYQIVIFFFLINFLVAQNLIVDGTISNAANWNGQEAPYNSGTYENAYLSGGCSLNYVMEVDVLSVPQQTVTGFIAGAQYILNFRCAYRTTCAPSNNPTNLQITFTDAPGVLTYNLAIPNTQNVLTAFTVTFTNNAATTHTLQFNSPGNSASCGSIVDDISLIPLTSPGGVGTTSLTLWLKAGSINTADNSNVYGWLSQGTSPIPLTPPCGTAPVYKTGLATAANNLIANYNPYITFNGSNQYLEYTATTINLLDNSGAGVGGSYFSVYEGGSNGTVPFAHRSTNNSRIFGGTNQLVYANSTGTGTNNNVPITKSTRVNIISSNGKSTGITLSDINGLNQVTNNASADVDYVTAGVRRNTTGTYSQFFDGGLSEIIMFNSLLSNTQAHQVRSYLAAKYGVTLTDNTTTAALDERSYIASDGTTIFWNYTLNTAYHNNITAIGRDDGSSLTQLKSISTDADAGSNTGNGMLIINNVASFASDKSFFATGHNGTTIASGANFADVPAGIQSRLKRIWKFQKTGSGIASSISVSFDLTGFSPLVGTDLRLLVSASPAFASASIISGAYVAPYFTASLPTGGGEFYTLASINSTSTPLPVTVVSFDAEKEQQYVRLKWITQSENNSDFFTVQRSVDGINFSDIGEVRAAGNSNTLKNYDFLDRQPFKDITYYRLKLVNKDRTIQYYNIVSITSGREHPTTFSLFPNPNNGEFTFDFTGIENNHTVEVSIISESGALVFNDIFYSQSLNNNQVQLNLKEKISKGIYYCKIESEGIKQTIKVVVN